MKLLYDPTALYIGIMCHELHPGHIVATQLGRDADLGVDDRITVVIDPFIGTGISFK